MAEHYLLPHNCTKIIHDPFEESRKRNHACSSNSVAHIEDNDNSKVESCGILATSHNQKPKCDIELSELTMDSELEEKKENFSTKAYSTSNEARSTYESLTNLEELEDLVMNTIEGKTCHGMINTQPVLVNTTMNYQQSITEASPIIQQSTRNLTSRLYSLYSSKRDSMRSYLSLIYDIETKLYIVRSIGFCLALFCSCALLFWTPDSDTIPYNGLLAICYSYLTFMVLEDVIRLQCMQRDTWRRVEDAFHAVDAINGILFLVCLSQNNLNPILRLTVSTLILVATNMVYPFLSQAPKIVKLARTSLKSYYTIQGILLMAQFNNVVDIDWRNILTLTWCYLTGTLVFSSLLAIVVIAFHSYHFIKAIIWFDYADVKICLEEIISGVWYLYYGCSSAIMFMAAFGVCQRLEDFDEFNFVHIASLFGLIIASVMILLSLVAFNVLTKCVSVYAGIQLFEELSNPNEMGVEEFLVKVTLKTEAKEAFFVQCSETYFMDLDAEKTQKTKDLLANKPKVNRLNLGSLNSWMTQKDTMSEALLSMGLENHEEVKSNVDNICYICCEEKADAVLADCKHGGVCYECVTTLIRKKPECMECRSSVSGVFQIDQKPILNNVYKSKKFSKVIKTQSQRSFI